MNVEELKKELFYTKKNANVKLSDELLDQVHSYCEVYKEFLDSSKTEREACYSSIEMAKQRGFVPFSKNEKYKPGDKIYYINRDKSLILAIIGKRSLKDGIKLAAAHIDSPRLDLKPNPLYEDSQLAFFKTHYYGGIKKYQWTAVPLSLHGVILKANGEKVEVNIGEDEKDPVFCVNDLLPHL